MQDAILLWTEDAQKQLMESNKFIGHIRFCHLNIQRAMQYINI